MQLVIAQITETPPRSREEISLHRHEQVQSSAEFPINFTHLILSSAHWPF